jgi:CBS domain-containing protein
MFAAQKFSGEGSIGSGIVILITSTTIIVQLVGPSLIKIAVEKAGEVGKNITEDDFIKQSKAKDVMEDVPKIPINMKAHDILKIFSEYDVYYYPVVDENDELKGVITIDNLKTALLNPETYDFLIAEDLMTPVSFKINENTPLVEVKETIKNNNLDFVVIVDDSGKFKGIIETGKLDKFISRKIIELRKAAEA